MPTPTLDSFRPSPHPHDVRPIGRLHPDGVLEACGPHLPPLGPCLLVLWRPGEEPAFEAVHATLARGPRATWTLARPTPPPREAWVVLWAAAPGAPRKGS